ncbi:hypothetical protein V2A60_002539 [Cordyceps javanica]|uniref:Glucoamylase-like protein n=1 Tax=Cordyceps javanica TaxID=43265 RepID=A0A545UY89_9HYPO|nr:glucoamylase-like protein [Cordyceps javanica]TQW06297.1 glucoamylase-like protein [Cordyceps javanica]
MATESPPAVKRTHNDAEFLSIDCGRKPLFQSTTPPVSRSLVAWSKPASRSGSDASQPQLQSHLAISFERCISSYYHNFHASHPLVLPQTNLLPLIKGDAVQPLLSAMHWVGSKYIAPEKDQEPLMNTAISHVEEAESKSANGFTVQAMVVLLLALDGAGYPQQATELLCKAKSMLLSLGMNSQQFLFQSEKRSQVLDESWRRTWWELYVLDGMFAGAHRATTFSLFDVPTDVGLPCEEDEYETNQIPEPRTVEDLSDRDLSLDNYQFSSFTYRILSVQNLGQVIRNSEAAELDADVHTQLEVLLTSWRHSLPASKRDSLQRDGRPDEMMFQAHMLNHTTSILLHRSRANLNMAPSRTIDACAPLAVATEDECSDPRVSLHTQHVITAANELGKLMTHRTRLTLHTHFFICAVVLASIVHIGAWSGGDDAVREQVRLCIGALRQMSTVWGLAGKALGQVKDVVGQIHFERAQSRQMEQFLVDVTDEDMVGMFAADTSTLADMDSSAVGRCGTFE